MCALALDLEEARYCMAHDSRLLGICPGRQAFATPAIHSYYHNHHHLQPTYSPLFD